MGAVEGLLAGIMPQLEEADTALHNDHAELRKSLWSHHDPVTLLGAAFTKSGWDAISPVFDWSASTFSSSDAFTYEVMAADVSGDLAYVAGIEHPLASIWGAPAAPYSLRSPPSSDETMADGRSSTGMRARCRTAATPLLNNYNACGANATLNRSARPVDQSAQCNRWLSAAFNDTILAEKTLRACSLVAPPVPDVDG